MLLNLLFNAVKFTPQGKITVSAAVQQEFASHLRLHFAVEDTGIGIRADDTQKLFGLFSKIRDNRVQNPLGVGLGLAICKQLVELMRGQIHVSSVYGKGTKFFFTVIVSRPTKDEVDAFVREAAGQQALRGSEAAAEKVKANILVVEDNEFNMEVVRCMLENDGHVVAQAFHGQQGVEAYVAAHARSEPYDLILMDCNMPVLDGYEATKKIRKMQAERDKILGDGGVPVVA